MNIYNSSLKKNYTNELYLIKINYTKKCINWTFNNAPSVLLQLKYSVKCVRKLQFRDMNSRKVKIMKYKITIIIKKLYCEIKSHNYLFFTYVYVVKQLLCYSNQTHRQHYVLFIHYMLTLFFFALLKKIQPLARYLTNDIGHHRDASTRHL